MKRSLFVHVGYPKTGTTFLQNEVFPSLKTVHYVRSLEIRSALHRIRHQDEYSFDPDKILAEIKPCLREGGNLISNEGLAGDFFYHRLVNSGVIARRLKALFPDSGIVITIRNQYDLIESLYRQYLHKGGVKHLRDFVHYSNGQFEFPYGTIDPTVTINLFDFTGPIREYVSLFGRANVIIVPFELMKKGGAGIFVQRILEGVGISESPDFKNIVYNPGYGAVQAGIARWINRYLKSNYNESALITDATLPLTGKIDAGKLRILLQSETSRKIFGRKEIVDAPLKEAVYRRFAEANQRLDEEFSIGLAQELPGVYY